MGSKTSPPSVVIPWKRTLNKQDGYKKNVAEVEPPFLKSEIEVKTETTVEGKLCYQKVKDRTGLNNLIKTQLYSSNIISTHFVGERRQNCVPINDVVLMKKTVF